MYKKIMATILCIAMISSSMPIPVLAANVSEDEISSEEYVEDASQISDYLETSDNSNEEKEALDIENEELNNQYDKEDAEGIKDKFDSLDSATDKPTKDMVTPLFIREKIIDGIKIKVTAPIGVFPADARLKVEAISIGREIKQIEEVIEENIDDGYAIEETFAYDIKILDKDGNEIEPNTALGEVEVTFSNIGAIDTVYDDQKELSVYHVADDLDIATEIKTRINIEEDAAVFTAEHFSIYTVVIVSGNKKDKIFHYYQGPTKAKSYFTIYNEKELINYADLLESYLNGTLKTTDSIQTILVNSDEANPIEGITGHGQSTSLRVSDLYFSAKVMDDITVSQSWSAINKLPANMTFDGNGKVLKFTNLATTNLTSGDMGVLIKENQGIVKNVVLSGDYSFTGSGTVGGIVGYNNGGKIINSIFNNGQISFNGTGIGDKAIVGRSAGGAVSENNYVGSTSTPYPSGTDLESYNSWVKTALENGTYTDLLYWTDKGLDTDEITVPPIEGQPAPEITGKARVIIRVDGQKAEIGEAITGAEALAIKERDNDSAAYITMVRSDDLSVYETDLSNLEEGKSYDIYYVYEDENDTISSGDGSLILSRDHNEVVIEYVSVTYDIEGANTYKKLSDGKLSENIMAAVRVEKSGGGYRALEDYTAVIKAVEGYEIPELSKNVKVSVGGQELPSEQVSYTYDDITKEGTLLVNKLNITGPITITVRPDKKTDLPSCTVILHTKGGSIADPLWIKDEDDQFKYSRVIYQGESVTLPSPSTYLNSNSVVFKGWYKTITPSGTDVKTVDFKQGEIYHYYAEYVLAKGENSSSNIAQGHNGKMWYSYNSHGNADVRGYLNGNTFKTTYGNAGFNLYYKIGDIGNDNTGTHFSTNRNVGDSAFVNPYGNIWVSQQFTFDGNYIYITYIFENRDLQNNFDSIFNLALGADIQIGDTANSDRATIQKESNFISMTADGNAFILYIDGKDFGVDKIDRYWYGYYYASHYSGGSWTANVFAPTPDTQYDGISDSAMSYGWTIPSIPAGGIVTRSLKIGAGDATSLSNLSGTFMSGVGSFSDGKTNYSVESLNKNIEVKANGEVWVDNVKKVDPNLTPAEASRVGVKTLTREGYKFAYWSTTDADYNDKPAQYTNKLADNLTLYAIWMPKPDRFVKNNSSIQKVKGNDNLIVPKELGSITIENTTPGSQNADGSSTYIKQGETVQDAAGYASGFSGIMKIEGADDRYLLPDDITVTIIGTNSSRTILTKDTGYEYRVWNNRKNATIIVRNQFINGDIEIKAVGYELPPVTATSVNTSVKAFTLKAGDTAEFSVHAQTSKNHVASYQWYVAPYYEITLDNKLYWTYQNQNGIPISNGNTSLWGIPLEVSGANRDTLRIKGLSVNPAGLATNDIGLHKGGYHVYCVVTSTRNITGQQVIAVSSVAEVEVVQNQYSAPTGLTGSAATYKGNPGSADGKILIATQADRPRTLQYKKKELSIWNDVTPDSSEVTGLVAGTYQFRYKGDANYTASSSTEVVVGEGRQIRVIYNANDGTMTGTSTSTIEKLVDYGTNVSASSLGIPNPVKTGSSFIGWDKPEINNIKEDTNVTAKYANDSYTITLNNNGADTANKGTEYLYEKYGVGFYKDVAAQNPVSGDHPIDLPKKAGYDFEGYYSESTGGVKMINADGCLNSNIENTSFLDNQTLYAKWIKKPVTFDSPNGGVVTETTTEGKYNVTVTNNTGNNKANVIYIYSDGVFKEIKWVTFENGKTTFEIDPNDIGGAITFVVGFEEEGQIPVVPQNLTYTITYKNVDGSRDGTEFEGTFITTKPESGVKGVSVTLPTVSRSGYTFVGWFTTARGTGNSIVAIPETNNSDITVYAKWKANKYTLALETNEGEYVEGYAPAVQYEHGLEPEIVLPTAEDIYRDGYTFKGWYKNANLGSDGSNSVTTVDKSQIGKVTYYLKWEAIPHYTITFTTDNAEGKIYVIEDKDSKPSPVDVEKGTEYQFRVLLKSSSYRIENVYANGRPIFSTNGLYTIYSVNDNMEITVEAIRLAQTDIGTAHPNAVAYIDLPDGTTAFFEPETNTDEGRAEALNKALEFASKEYQGEGSLTVKLNQDIKNQSIKIEGSIPVVLDLNGHKLSKSDGGTSALLVDKDSNLKITNTLQLEGVTDYISLPVENTGHLTIGNDVVVDKLKNYGEAVNNGHIKILEQSEGEDGRVSFIDNTNGAIDTSELKSGYLISDTPPSNSTGYTTVMNGNQYYVDFQTAVNIASQTEGDSVITIVKEVDLKTGGNAQTINIGKDNKKISIDLNGHNINNGTINVNGDVEIKNSQSTTNGNYVNSTFNNTNKGQLTIDNNVKLEGKITNNGEINVKPGGSIGGSDGVTNNAGGSINNNGNITAAVTNNGDVVNNGTMNNVDQQGGHLNNNGVINNEINIKGGSYAPGTGDNVSPKEPTSGVTVIMNTDPPTGPRYYATLKEAIEDINNSPETDNSGTVIKLSKDIIIDSDIIIDPKNPDKKITIDLDGHNITPKASGQGSIDIGRGKVVFDNTSTTITDDKGKISVPVVVSGNIGSGSDTTKAGSLEIENKVKIDNLTNNGGTVNNNGTVTELTQSNGQTNNGARGNIGTLTQTGGATSNEGTVKNATLNGGGYNGNGIVNEQETPVAQFDGKKFQSLKDALEYATKNGGGEVELLEDTNEVISFAPGANSAPVTIKLGDNGNSPKFTQPGGITLGSGARVKFTGDTGYTPAGGQAQIGDYIYGDIKDAVDDANKSDTETTIKLLDNVSVHSGGLNINNENSKKITLDLNGKNLGSGSGDGTVSVGGSVDVVDNNTSGGTNNAGIKAPVIIGENGDLNLGVGTKLEGSVTNNGGLTVANGATVTGAVTNTNTGSIENKGSISGTVNNSGNVNNQGEVSGTVTHNGGQFNGNAATGGQTGGNVELKTTDGQGNPVIKYYPDLKSATEAAKAGDEIKLLSDIDGTTTVPENVVINKPGVVIDLNGHTIGENVNIAVSTEAKNPAVSIKDSADQTGSSGSVEGTITNNGGLSIDGSATVNSITNDGVLHNNGTITGTLTQNGGTTVNNGSINDINQTNGTVNNGTSGIIDKITQS